MKIIHSIFSFNVGGAETMLVDIINQQCKEASVSLIIVNEKLNIDLLNTIDKRVNVYLFNRKESDKMQLLSAFLKINQIVNEINPDVIHCHDNKLFPFFIRWKRKTCLTVHSVNLSVAFIKQYSKVFAISVAVQQNIKKLSGMNAQVVLNGIEIAQYKRRVKYDFDPKKDEFKIIQISRLTPKQKGQHIAIRAIRLLKEQNPGLNFKLYFVGSGEGLMELEELAVQYAVRDQIVFEGTIDRNQIKNNLQNYHLLIQPSLVEGFGLTVVEGFACGLPVVASDLDGPKEIIETLHSGLLVKPDDPADLAEKIKQIILLYVNKEINKQIVRTEELSRFDVQTTARNYIQSYPVQRKIYFNESIDNY